MKKIDYYNKFLERLNKFLGIKLELKAYGNQIEFIPKLNSKFMKKNIEEIGDIFLAIDLILERYYENNNDVFFTDLIEEFCQKFIAHMIKNKLTVTNNQINFMDNIKVVCNETYESKDSNLNILLFKNNNNISKELDKIELDFIPFDTPKKIENILSEKLSLILLNGDNLILIVGEDFKCYGVGINRGKTIFKERMIDQLRIENNLYLISFMSKLSKDILELIDPVTIKEQQQNGLAINEKKIQKLVEYANEKMGSSKKLFKKRNIWNEVAPYLYMEIKNKELKIFLQNSIDNYLSYHGGRWKLKSFHVLKFLIIENFYMDTLISSAINGKTSYENIIENIITNVDILISLIKDLLEMGKGALFVILKRTIKNDNIENIFLGGTEGSSIYRKTILKNNQAIPLKEHNFKYLKLISKVDGAVTLDNEFNLLSFGRLVKLDTKNSSENIEGARTAAAISSSKYGLAIKVSEDKKITVWKNQIKILEI
ncbi:MAG: hypothetical protein DSY38_05000 [Fusobacteria bacterium]|nr:MAG: hypothetical protein DSY38_05000 [Fusobacteriota bacterium]